MTEQAKEGRQIPLDTATFKQLRAFAETDMGITIVNGWQTKQLKEALIANGWEHAFILAADEPASPAAPVAAAAAPKAAVPAHPSKPGAPPEAPEPMVKLMINQQEGAGGKRAIFVGVNGMGILLPRNKEIEVKLRYLNALDIAVERTVELDEETNTQEVKDMPSYPFQVRVMPPPEAIAAWLAWEAYVEAQERDRDRKHDAERQAHNRGVRAA